jgi:rhodanese-related sulfurtransferase
MYFVALIFLFLLAFYVFTSEEEDMSGYKNISAKDAKQMTEKDDVYVLDVRTPSEFNSSHLKGATLIPVTNVFGSNLSSDQLLQARTDEVPKDKKVLVYCKTGKRSEAASEILVKAGNSQVYSLVGGITAWTEAGFPVVSSEEQKGKS